MPDGALRAATPFEAPATGPDEDLAVGVALLLLTRGPACLVAFDAPEDEFDAIEPDDPFLSAAAIAGVHTAAAPIPSATARAPTRPTERR